MNTPPRRLVVVTPTFHPEPIGTPLYATDLCRWFSTHGWDVHVVTAQPFYPQFQRYEGYGTRTRHDMLEAITLTRLPTIVPQKGRATWRAISDLNFLAQGLARSPQIRQPDAVLSISPGNPWTALVGAAIARRRTPHVVLVHDIQSGLAATTSNSNRLLHALLKGSERRSLDAADRVLGLTPHMVKALRTIGVTKPTGVLPLWSTVTPPSEFVSLDPEVQYSGNFGEKQAISQLPALAEALSRIGIPLRARGAGPRFDELLPQLARSTGGRLVAEPLAPANELVAALARSPVHVVLQAPGTGSYVMPSKILNALVCGTTVVAMADHGSAVAGLAQHTPGLHVVPTTRVDLMAETVQYVMAAACEPTTRKHIATAATKQFSRDVRLHRLEQVLRSPGSLTIDHRQRNDGRGCPHV